MSKSWSASITLKQLALAIQELFLIIKQDCNIKGYKLNIISQEEIKLRGYADDVKLILIDN